MGRRISKQEPASIEEIRNDAWYRLLDFAQQQRFAARNRRAARLLQPLGHAFYTDAVARLFEELPFRSLQVDHYCFLDHFDGKAGSMVDRFLADDWAPPAGREYLRALAASPRRVWRTRLLPDGGLELRDFWTGARRRLEPMAWPFWDPPPPLMMARVVLERGPNLYLAPDYSPLPDACADRLELLPGADAWCRTPEGRDVMSQAVQAVADGVFSDVVALTEHVPYLPAAFRARFRIVADEGLLLRVLDAGFELLNGNLFYEIRTELPGAGIVALRLGRRGVSITGADEIAVRIGASRLAEVAGGRLQLWQMGDVANPAWHEQTPAVDALVDLLRDAYDPDAEEPTDEEDEAGEGED